MAGREGTVAPRERINLRVKTDVNGQMEERELPLKLLVVGDFTQRPDGSPVEERETINVTKSNFDDVLREQDLTLTIEIEDVVSGKKGRTLPARLAFNSLKSFEPDALAEQVPELRKLLEVRNALKALKGPLGSDREFRRRLADAMNDEAAVATILSEIAPSDTPVRAGETDDDKPENGAGDPSGE